MTKKASSEASQQNDSLAIDENAAVSSSNHKVEAANHFGQVAFVGSAEVSADLYRILANEGFEGRLQSAASKLDAHKDFGNFGHKGPDGKIVPRIEGWKRGSVPFTLERAELVQKTLETTTLPETPVAVTTSRYIASAVKQVTVDDAAQIVGKNAIAKRGENANELAKLAKLVEFTFVEVKDLNVNNTAFVEKVASFYANL
jgi:hypothetical protein